jgi:hypothetical protein
MRLREEGQRRRAEAHATAEPVAVRPGSNNAVVVITLER